MEQQRTWNGTTSATAIEMNNERNVYLKWNNETKRHLKSDVKYSYVPFPHAISDTFPTRFITVLIVYM